MANIEKFSEGLIDLAERFADMTDAAKGRGNRRTQRFGMHWFLLPAAGAGLYRLAASKPLLQQARSMAMQAKELASDLPDDLMGRVEEVTDHKNGRKAGGRSSAQTSSGSRSGASRSRSSGARARSSSGRPQGSSGRKRNQARKSRATSSR
jgi:hypothetical protein